MNTVEAADASHLVGGIVYGEGPRWHDGRLWFTDGFANTVYSVSEDGEVHVEAEVVKASGLGWLADGTLVVSGLFAAKIYHVDTRGKVVGAFDVSNIAWTTNDLLVAPGDRTYVDLYRAGGDAIGLVGSDGAVRIVAEGLERPNGMGLLPGREVLVVSETKKSRILSYPVDLDGGLGTPSVFADLGPDRHPDGLCVDLERGVWVGCYDTGEFVRVLAGGVVTHRVAIEKGWAIAPALGGSDGRTLYMMVDDTSVEGLRKGESTGWIMTARVDVPGSGSP